MKPVVLCISGIHLFLLHLPPGFIGEALMTGI